MATSGSIDFTVNRNNIIQEALELLGVASPGENIEPEDITTCSRSLNMMVKSWSAKGMHLWTEEEGTLFLVADQIKHLLGNDQAHWAVTSTITSTQLSADEAIGQTTLSVDSSTGMAASDHIGVMNDNDDLEWGTISSIPGSTSVITDTALVVAASEDNWIYTFTNKAERPLKIIDVQRRDESTNPIDIPVNLLSRAAYYDLSNKTETGRVVDYYYDPQLTSGDFYPWLTPEDSADRLIITFRRTLEDFDAATDNPDFPQEWFDALTYNLAVRVAHKFAVSLSIKRDLQKDAIIKLAEVEGFDNENASIFFQPNYRGQMR